MLNQTGAVLPDGPGREEPRASFPVGDTRVSPALALTDRANAAAALTLADAVRDWDLALRASNKAPRTIDAYVGAATKLAGFLGDLPVQAIGHRDIQRYLVHLAETPHQRTGRRVTDSYVAGHYRRLQQLFRWLEEEGEIQRSPFYRLRAPAVPEKPVPVLDDVQIRRLLATARGKRNNAMVRVLLDTGVRVSELVSMRRSNPSLVHGKGRRPRTVYWSHTTELALRRYVRTRTDQDDCLWFGRDGSLSPSGVRQMLEKLGQDCGIPGLHPHMFRHTFAHRWRLSGGSEGDLMRLGGWRSREMLDRYGASAADHRAREAYRKYSQDQAQ